MSLNKWIGMGRLTKDPELRYTQSNIPVVSFTIAVDRNFKNSDGTRETDFINCVAWRQTAELVSKWFPKGRMMAVVGSLQTRTYDDKNGEKRYVTEVMVDEVSFTGEKREGNSINSLPRSDDLNSGEHSSRFYPDEDDSDLPF